MSSQQLNPVTCLSLFPEEIFQSHIAHWWSPDGARLAYATINDTLVPKMELPMFTGSPYPTGKEYHYPKVGGASRNLCFNPIRLFDFLLLRGGTFRPERRTQSSLCTW